MSMQRRLRPLGRAGDRVGADRAADRAGEQRLDRLLARLRGGRDAAVRLHDVERLEAGEDAASSRIERRRGSAS